MDKEKFYGALVEGLLRDMFEADAVGKIVTMAIIACDYAEEEGVKTTPPKSR